MFKSRGMRLPMKYIFENLLFDFFYKVETHLWEPKENNKNKLKNYEDGVLYMPSWSSVIKKSTVQAFSLLKSKENLNIIDFGCGKGKALIVWRKTLKLNNQIKLFGIEYDPELADKAKENLKSIDIEGIIKNSNAEDESQESYSKNLILYFYNPFNEKILEKVLQNFSQSNPVVIYVNPVHQNIFGKHGFKEYLSVKHWHPNGCYVIYTKSN